MYSFAQAALGSLCHRIWVGETGPKPVDGIWAPWWYGNVHKSRGFKAPQAYPSPFPLALYDLLEQSLPFYTMLRCHKRRTTSFLGPSLPPPSLPVPANEKLLVWVGDELLPRESAKVSVFDSVVQGRGAAWEGLRIYNGKIFKLNEHLDRLFDSAKVLAFSNIPNREEVTSGMSPAFNLYGSWMHFNWDHFSDSTNLSSVYLISEYRFKDSSQQSYQQYIGQDRRNFAKADDAIMLDKDGFVSETNATNIFLVKKGQVSTPFADYCLPGITRATVTDLVISENLVLHERHISLSEFHSADEVTIIDGRVIGNGEVGPITRRIQIAYKILADKSGIPIPKPGEA